MIGLILKGIGIGVANIMPGVSGGTLAVVFGVYDKLVEAIGGFLTASKKKRGEYIKFVAPILIGAVIGILLFAKILEYCYLNFPVVTGIGFILLILPSIPVIIRGEKFSGKNITALILGGIVTMLFIILGIKYGVKTGGVGVINEFTTKYGVKLFLSGAVAAGAMIIPGISGSLLLLMIGEYFNVLFSINTVVEKLFSFAKGEYVGSFLKLLGENAFLNLYTFAGGIIIGIVAFSKLIDFCLKKFRSVTLFFIDGVVIVSILQILMNIFPKVSDFMNNLANILIK